MATEVYDLYLATARQAIDMADHERLIQLLKKINHEWPDLDFCEHVGELCCMLTLVIHHGAPLYILDDICTSMRDILDCWCVRMRGFIPDVYARCAKRNGEATQGEELMMIKLMILCGYDSHGSIEELYGDDFEDESDLLDFFRVDQHRYPLLRTVIEDSLDAYHGRGRQGDPTDIEEWTRIEDWIGEDLEKKHLHLVTRCYWWRVRMAVKVGLVVGYWTHATYKPGGAGYRRVASSYINGLAP